MWQELKDWLQVGAIVGTGLFALFKAGGYVTRITLSVESVNKKVESLIDQFKEFIKKEDKRHDGIDNRLDKIHDYHDRFNKRLDDVERKVQDE